MLVGLIDSLLRASIDFRSQLGRSVLLLLAASEFVDFEAGVKLYLLLICRFTITYV